MNLRLLWILWNGIRQHSNLPKETDVAKRRENSGLPQCMDSRPRLRKA